MYTLSTIIATHFIIEQKYHLAQLPDKNEAP